MKSYPLSAVLFFAVSGTNIFNRGTFYVAAGEVFTISDLPASEVKTVPLPTLSEATDIITAYAAKNGLTIEGGDMSVELSTAYNHLHYRAFIAGSNGMIAIYFSFVNKAYIVNFQDWRLSVHVGI